MVPFDYLIKEKKIASLSACQLIDFHWRPLETAEITVAGFIQSTRWIKTDWKWPSKDSNAVQKELLLL